MGPCTPAFTSVPCALSRHTDASRLSFFEIVSYTTSIPPGYAIGRSWSPRRTPPDHSAADSINSLTGECAKTAARAQLARQLTLALEAGDDADFDVGVQRAENRHRARPERTGAVHQHSPSGRR